jgi:hypothetical protein
MVALQSAGIGPGRVTEHAFVAVSLQDPPPTGPPLFGHQELVEGRTERAYQFIYAGAYKNGIVIAQNEKRIWFLYNMLDPTNLLW